jgi:hypothetical protein
MAFKNITRHDNCDIYKGTRYNDIEPYGFDKSKTLGEMIDLAVLHKCPIIVKAGTNAKWYLKGKGRDDNLLKVMIEMAKYKYERPGVFCIHIEY